LRPRGQGPSVSLCTSPPRRNAANDHLTRTDRREEDVRQGIVLPANLRVTGGATALNVTRYLVARYFARSLVRR